MLFSGSVPHTNSGLSVARPQAGPALAVTSERSVRGKQRSAGLCRWVVFVRTLPHATPRSPTAPRSAVISSALPAGSELGQPAASQPHGKGCVQGPLPWPRLRHSQLRAVAASQPDRCQESGLRERPEAQLPPGAQQAPGAQSSAARERVEGLRGSPGGLWPRPRAPLAVPPAAVQRWNPALGPS